MIAVPKTMDNDVRNTEYCIGFSTAKTATGNETVVSDLTYELRSGSPDFVDRMVAITYAGMAMDAVERGEGRRDDGDQLRLLRDGTNSRSQARAAESRGCHDVQHGALPADLRSQAGTTDFPDASLIFGPSPLHLLTGFCGSGRQ